jgi:ferredoxin-NADP reductase
MNAILRAAQRLTTPLLPDDFLDLVDPLWGTTSLRARIVAERLETSTSVSLTLRPSIRLPLHLPGQHVRLGVDIGGVRHWRSYSITSPATSSRSGHVETFTVTVQRQRDGLVSGHLTDLARSGDIVQLEAAQGDFHLPASLPPRVLLIGAGSGITPLMGMLRTLYPGGRQSRTRPSVRVHLIYSARDRGRRIFADELTALAARTSPLTVHFRDTGRQGRLSVADLDAVVPGWQDLPTWACGPTDLLADLTSHWRSHGIDHNLATEQFQPIRSPGEGAAGRLSFTESGKSCDVAEAETLLTAGERAGILMPHGCRMGICHNCVLTLESGQVQDTRTGELHGEPGDVVQTCISRPVSDVSLKI